MDEALESRLKHCTNLPSLPTVAARVIELSRDPTADMGTVAEAVTLDPALSVKIMRMANSPLYARRRKCENFRQALVLLGLNGTLTLALTFSLVGSLRRGGADKGMDYGAYWRRSLLAAVAGRALGEYLDIAAREELFLAALMQDIGMLALARAVPEQYADIAGAAGRHDELCATERTRLASDHADVGAWLLEHWSLPEHLRRAVAASHDQAAVAVEGEERTFVDCVFLSGRLADVWLDDNREQSCREAMRLAEQHLGLSGDELAQILAAVAAEVPDVEAMFETDLLDADRMESILEEAKETLVLRNLQALQEASEMRQAAEGLQEQARVLEEKSKRDDLTRVYNRGHLDQVLEEEFAHANKNGWPMSIAFVDLDNFKQVNDQHGHQMGDQVLVAAARLLLVNTRQSDCVGRYGGEEFVLVLPGCGSTPARTVCERIVDSFATAKHDLGDGQHIGVTVSVGVVTHGEGQHFDSVADLLKSADVALYAAKSGGRNRLVMYETGLKAIGDRSIKKA